MGSTTLYSFANCCIPLTIKLYLLGVSGGGGGGGRGNFGGGGGASNNFLVGNQSGITGTNSFGLNYANKFGKKVDVTGSYFFNRTGNSNVQSMQQRFLLAGDSTDQFYNENSRTSTTNLNHRLNFRIEYNIDPKNSLIITPRLSFQDNTSNSLKAGLTTLGDGSRINSQDNTQRNANNGYNFSNDLLYRHSFAKKGRTVSVNVNTQLNDKNGTRNLYSKNLYYDNFAAMRGDTIDQQSYTNSDGMTWGSNVIYTEPISSTGQLQFNYGLTLSNSNSSRDTYNMSFDDNTYSELDTLLTNNFDNRYLTNRAGIGYRYRKNSWSANFGVDYQNTGLYSEQLAPNNVKVDQSFSNFLPNLMLSYRSKSGTQFRSFSEVPQTSLRFRNCRM